MAERIVINVPVKLFLRAVLAKFPDLMNYTPEQVYSTVQYEISNGMCGERMFEGLVFLNPTSRNIGSYLLSEDAWEEVKTFFAFYPFNANRASWLEWYWPIWQAELAEDE